jgi:hypothetical protein
MSSSHDWEPVFSVHTPWAELQAIIDERIHECLVEWLETLLADPDLSDAHRGQAWAFAAPRIRMQTRAALEAAWRRLQCAAAAPSGPVQ